MIEEWLEKINEEEGSEWTVYDINPVLAERYKNFCLKDLEAKILHFRVRLNEIQFESEWEKLMNERDNFFEFYDEHFNIISERHGRTE